MSDVRKEIEELSDRAARLYREADFAGALAAAAEALALARQRCGEDDALTADCLSSLGTLLAAGGDFERARQHHELALEVRRRALGGEHPDTALSLALLGDLLHAAGDYAAARPYLEEALAVNRRALGANHPHTAASLNNLGSLLLESGDHAAARPCLEEALATTRCLVGDDHPDTAACHHSLGCLLQATGAYAEARACHEQALDVSRRVLGENHPDTARSLNSLGDVLRAMGDQAAACRCLEEALAIRRRVFGDEHRSTVHSLYNLGFALEEAGDYVGARRRLEEALRLGRRVLGDDHPHTAAILTELGGLLRRSADYAGARRYLEQALEIRRRVHGDDHPATAGSLTSLGALLQAQGDYHGARRCLEQALDIRRRVHGDDHLDTARSLHNLGALLEATGDYEGARVLLSRSLDVHRCVLGGDHPETAVALASLGAVLQEAGDYAGARRCLEEAIGINRRPTAAGDSRTAVCLRNLGGVLKQAGDYTGARRRFEEALEIDRKLFGEDHPETAASLSWLGTLLTVMGEAADARECFEQALDIRRRVLGRAHPHTALSLNDLGSLLRTTGDFEGARRCDQEALAIQRQSFGETHHHTVTSLNNLGLSLKACGDIAGARIHLERALEASRAGLGESHPYTVAVLYNLGLQAVISGQPAEGLSLLQRAAAGDDRLVGQILPVGSERQRSAFLQTFRGRLDTLLSLTLRYFGDTPAAVRTAMDFALRRKSLGLELLSVRRDVTAGERHPHLAPTLRELATLRAQIGRHILTGPGTLNREDHERTLAEWSERRDRLESELARQIPELDLERRLRAADHRAVAAALGPGEVLVEFLQFTEFEFQVAAGGGRWSAGRYVAFVLSAGEPDAVKMIDLGESEPINQLIADFRACVSSGHVGQVTDCPSPGEARDLVRRSGAGCGGEVGAALRRAVFDPLIPALGARTRVLLSPDGQLARLSFAALPTDDGRRLADVYRSSYAGCGRDALRFNSQPSVGGGPPLVVCDPDFDLGSTLDPDETENDTSTARSSRDLKRALVGLSRLPGTLAEGVAVGEMLGVDPWWGDQALKGPLLVCRSPRVLHLATHGFFLEDQEVDLDRELWGRLLDASGQLRADVGENPLLRSGLALAGANAFLRGGVPPLDVDNGLLTALEVTGMDLLGTELVVLSACQSGEGDVHVGEGVIGLQRAFTVAGARTIVMSLWSVDDEATRDLMVAFYRRLLDGEGKADALRHAQDELRTRPEYAHPYYWAAFVCQGDPRPLPAGTS